MWVKFESQVMLSVRILNLNNNIEKLIATSFIDCSLIQAWHFNTLTFLEEPSILESLLLL